jgi:Protein of unknown function (DUF4231)
MSEQRESGSGSTTPGAIEAVAAATQELPIVASEDGLSDRPGQSSGADLSGGAGEPDQSEPVLPPQLDDLFEPAEPLAPAAPPPPASPPPVQPAAPPQSGAQPAPLDPTEPTNSTEPADSPSSNPRSAYAVTRRANHLLAWYDQHANRARIGYWVIKIIQLILGAAVPVVAGLHAPAAVTGSLGALIVVLEGIQQLFQFHENWIRYRLSATSVAREKSMYDARVGDYASGRPVALLALRIENIASTEATAWAHSSQSSPSALSESSPAAAT